MKERKNKNEEPDYSFLEDPTVRKKRERIKYLIIILLNSILFYGVYAVLVRFSFWQIAVVSYLIALVALAIFYVTYNRGFVRKGVTVDMLPDSMSEEEKEAYVKDGEERLRKSKWCLTILFPLIFTFFMDIFYLFVYEPYFASFFSGLLG